MGSAVAQGLGAVPQMGVAVAHWLVAALQMGSAAAQGLGAVLQMGSAVTQWFFFSRNLGNLTSRNPLCLSRPVTGLLHLYRYLYSIV